MRRRAFLHSASAPRQLGRRRPALCVAAFSRSRPLRKATRLTEIADEYRGAASEGRRSMNTPNVKFWFPAKKFGYGWGPPNCWQGWVVIAIFFGLVGAGAVFLLPDKRTLYFL